MRFEANARICGEIFELLVQNEPDDLRLQVWKEMIDEEIIKRRGHSDGVAAGSWVIDGNTSDKDILALKKGIEDGDPAILDQLPVPRLSGEYADDPTWETILREESIGYDPEMERDDLYEAYVNAFTDGVNYEVNRVIRARLS